MNDKKQNEESLELLDAIEIGIDLSDYEPILEDVTEDLYSK